MVPLDHLVSEVFAVAKQDLFPGDKLDSIGGIAYYSFIDRYEIAKAEKLLPVGLAKGAQVIRAVKKDAPITLDDIVLSEPSTILTLRRLQDMWMEGAIQGPGLLSTLDSLATD